jgi:hypothetical protein
VNYAEFTEAAYEGLVRLALGRGYRFAAYGEFAEDRHVLWRHDIDVSVHRAMRLAEIEHALGVQATYFVDLHCPFYHWMETEICHRLRRIIDLGHAIGLHFDAAAYPEERWDSECLAVHLGRERSLLETVLSCPIETFSFHDPEASGLLRFDEDRMAGMVNAYGRRVREGYAYGSDSNGYWRHRPVPELIASGGHERLHILTHPEWWPAEPLAPRERIERCVTGRARAVMRAYDDALHRYGRRNIDRGNSP